RDRRARLRARDAAARRAREEPRGHVAGVPVARAVGPLLRGALARPVAGERAAALGGELGRPGAALARQLRGLRVRRDEAEVARGARRLALGAVPHRLRREAAEALLRPFPEGGEERLGPAAARAPQRAPSRREVRAARGERMA